MSDEPVHPDHPGERGELTVTADGSWWSWVQFSWEKTGRWVPHPGPVRTVTPS